MLDLDRLRQELSAVCEDAGIDSATLERRGTLTRAYCEEVRAACREWTPPPLALEGMSVRVV
jgi:hypothetical protein